MNKWNVDALAELALGFDSELWRGVAKAAERENEFFDSSSIALAVRAIWEDMLSVENLRRWLSAYRLPEGEPKRVGVVMAGNIPMVGLFDLLCVALSGHRATVKLSSKDSVMMGYVVEMMAGVGFDVEVADRIDRYDVDAVIVTGSDGAVSHFRREFKGLPSVFRGARHSVAVVESADQVNEGLVEDMFSYWGLGCRNVSHLLVCRGVDVADLASRFAQIERGHEYLKFKPFGDSYRYAKAMGAMGGGGAMDCGYFVLKQAELNQLPGLAQVGYSFYDDPQELDRLLAAHSSQLQCVSRSPYGACQHPALWDYADGVDVMEFLLNLY